MMKRILTGCILLVAGFVAVASPTGSQAQSCSDSDKANLRTCIDGKIGECAAGASACNPYAVALSLQDVKEIAINSCCKSKAKKKRTACLVREKSKYVPLFATGSQKAFFAAARTEINELRTSNCEGNIYSSLF